MKKCVHNLGDAKFLTGIYFMAFMILSTIGNYFIGGVREYSIITIWQILGISAVFAVLHFIQTSKLATAVKISVHGVLSYLTVVIFSVLCGWGFAQSASVFWQFTITFVVMYALIFVAFALYYKNEEARLNQKLDEYKKNEK